MVSAWQRAYLAIDLFATGSVATRAHPLRFVVDLVHIHHHAREAAQRGSVQRVRVDASAPLAAERVLVGRERRAGHRAVLRRASVHLDGRLVRVLQLGRQHVVVHFHHRHAHGEHISIRSHRGEHRALVCELRLSGLRSALSLGIRLSLGLSIRLSLGLSIRLSLGLSIRLSLGLSIRLSGLRSTLGRWSSCAGILGV